MREAALYKVLCSTLSKSKYQKEARKCICGRPFMFLEGEGATFHLSSDSVNVTFCGFLPTNLSVNFLNKIKCMACTYC